MGKKRIVKKGSENDSGQKNQSPARAPKRKIDTGILYVQATYNNTILTVADSAGNALMASSSGALGFKGAKKGTPFAAAKVGEVLGEKAAALGIREVSVVIRGVGSGRESSLRAFAGKGIDVKSITDMTAVPHNGPKRKKPRRV